MFLCAKAMYSYAVTNCDRILTLSRYIIGSHDSSSYKQLIYKQGMSVNNMIIRFLYLALRFGMKSGYGYCDIHVEELCTYSTVVCRCK